MIKKFNFIQPTKDEHPKMVRPIYPNGSHYVSEDNKFNEYDDFYHFNGDGVNDDTINDWIDQSLRFFEENPDAPYWRCMMSGGSSAVIVLKFQYDEYSLPYYEVIVVDNYKLAIVFPDEPYERLPF